MPGTRKVRIGLDGYIYRNSGTFGSPTWTQLKHKRDASLNLEINEVDASDSDSVWELIEKGFQKGTIEIDYKYHEGDTEWDQFLTDFLERDDPTEYLFIDGPEGTAGNKGWRITGWVMAAEVSYEQERPQAMSITIRPAANDDGNPQQFTSS